MPMQCEQAETCLAQLAVGDSVDGDTTLLEAAAHVESCETCREKLADYRLTLKVLADAFAAETEASGPVPTLSADRRAKLEARFNAPPELVATTTVEQPSRFNIRNYLRPLGVAASFGLVALGAWGLMNTLQGQPAFGPVATVHYTEELPELEVPEANLSQRRDGETYDYPGNDDKWLAGKAAQNRAADPIDALRSYESRVVQLESEKAQLQAQLGDKDATIQRQQAENVRLTARSADYATNVARLSTSLDQRGKVDDLLDAEESAPSADQFWARKGTHDLGGEAPDGFSTRGKYDFAGKVAEGKSESESRAAGDDRDGDGVRDSGTVRWSIDDDISGDAGKLSGLDRLERAAQQGQGEGQGSGRGQAQELAQGENGTFGWTGKDEKSGGLPGAITGGVGGGGDSLANRRGGEKRAYKSENKKSEADRGLALDERLKNTTELADAHWNGRPDDAKGLERWESTVDAPDTPNTEPAPATGYVRPPVASAPPAPKSQPAPGENVTGGKGKTFGDNTPGNTVPGTPGSRDLPTAPDEPSIALGGVVDELAKRPSRDGRANLPTERPADAPDAAELLDSRRTRGEGRQVARGPGYYEGRNETKSRSGEANAPMPAKPAAPAVDPIASPEPTPTPLPKVVSGTTVDAKPDPTDKLGLDLTRADDREGDPKAREKNNADADKQHALTWRGELQKEADESELELHGLSEVTRSRGNETGESLFYEEDEELAQEKLAKQLKDAPAFDLVPVPEVERVQELAQRLEEDAESDNLPAASNFKSVPVNPFVMTERDRFSTFGIDTDSASYALARKYVRAGFRPPAGAIRMEEFVNAFDYNYANQSDRVFTVHAEAGAAPYGENLTLLKVGVKAKTIGRENRKPAHLVFVIDASGSMDRPDRLPLVKHSLGLLVSQLGPTDRVSIVAYGTKPILAAEATAASDKKTLLNAINNIQAGGSTNMIDALGTGYTIARNHFKPGEINRVIVCSDGVANVGATDAQQMLDKVAANRTQGITLTNVGFGIGGYNDALMTDLAKKGDGNYVFVDTTAEAKRLFVDQLASTLQTVAKDAKIQVEFDPARVRRYRLIGYERRDIADKDFRNDTVDAGEVGSGQSATALYEVELLPAASNDNAVELADLGTVFVRYKNVQTGEVEEISSRLRSGLIRERTPSDDPRFYLAACAAEYAELLRGSAHARGASIDAIERKLIPIVQRLPLDRQAAELLDLVRRTKGLPAAP